jgi:hypothetical protein
MMLRWGGLADARLWPPGPRPAARSWSASLVPLHPARHPGYRSRPGSGNGHYDTIKYVALTGLSVLQSGAVPGEAGKSVPGGRGGG